MSLTPSAGTMPGFRTVDGGDIKKIMDAINGVTGGTAPVSASTVTSAGNVVSGGYVDQSTATGLTAAGTTRADALQLAKAVNNVTTAASGTGVILPLAATVGVGGSVIIFNNGVAAMKVYGAGSDTIDAAAATTGVTLTNAKRCQYFATAAATWISAQLGVVSA